MIPLEDTLCDVPHIRESQLLIPARKAYQSPETGITINIVVAGMVIKDCAYITTQYLPFFILSNLANPFSFYKGKVTLDQIKDFCARASTNAVTNQLLTLLIDKAKIQPDLDKFHDVSDPYNDFDANSSELQKIHNNIYILAKSFEVV